MTDFNLVASNGSVSVHSFANKGLATRYANKHGLTIAQNSGSLALIADATDDVDVDAVLSLIATDEPKTLRDVALAFDDATVSLMVTDIHESFERRDTFEASNGLSLAADSSYTRERDRMVKNSIAVARLFLACGVTASSVVERKVAESAMFNAKALKKVTEIAQFVCGFGQRLERVLRSFVACAIVATDKGVTVIDNRVNVQFLNSFDLTARLTDQDLIDSLDDLRHRAMTSGAETQSSQARNVLDVLNIGRITSVTKPRDAIVIDANHGFIAQFREAFMK